jgi:cytochrome c5
MMRTAFALALLASLVSTACAGTLAYPEEAFLESSDAGSTGDAMAATCPDIPTVLSQTCGVSGCHDATTKSQGMDLQSAGVASRLVGAQAKGGAGFLIDTTNPSASVVYTKLLQPPPYGARMPLTGAPFDDATTQCVLAWVTAEAHPAGETP